MKTTSTILVLVVLVIASLLAVRANRQVVQDRAAISACESQRAGLQAATATVEQRLRAAHAALVELDPKAGQPPGKPGAAGAANTAASGKETTAKPKSPAPQSDKWMVLAGDPRKMAEYAQNLRLYMAGRGGLNKSLGLSAEEAEKMKDLAVWTQQTLIDILAARNAQGLDRNSDAYLTLVAERNKKTGEKRREILGDRVPLFWEHARMGSVRQLAAELAGVATYSGEPVTFAQVERTTQILAAHSQRNLTSDFRGVIPNTVNWEAARAQLQDVLSPTQIATLGDIVQMGATQAKVDELTKSLTVEFKAKQAAK